MTQADWQTVLAEAVTDPQELCRRLQLPTATAEQARRGAEGFGVLVPHPYLTRIKPGDPDDPLLRQVLPTEDEQKPAPGFTVDPLCEASATTAPGLLSKYAGRSLIVTTGRCGVHCRFCFRRHGIHPTGEAEIRLAEEAIRHIAADSTVREVILSGGDPLTVDDRRLGDLAERIGAVDHVTRLRIHTRLPVLVPQRVTGDLMGWIRRSRLQVIVVLHLNHPAEIDDSVARAFSRLADAGIPMLSQSVLLRGVNDDFEVLARLFERLVDLRVMPYYLHQLDRVAGAAHFEVPEQTGIDLVCQLRRRLPGYAVPRYVRDIPGNRNKQPLI